MKLTSNFKEANKSLGANKLRSFLMMLGIMVSIATLMIVVSISKGAKDSILQRVQKMGAADIVMVIPGQEHGMGGIPSGESTLTLEDAEAIKNQLTQQVKDVAVVQSNQAEVKFNAAAFETNITGTTENFSRIRKWDIAEGDFFNQEAVDNTERVAVIGKNVVENLFSEEDPVGKTIKINNVNFEVIGVLAERGMAPNGRDFDDTIVIPHTTFDAKLFNISSLGQIITQSRENIQMDSIKTDIEKLLRERHVISSPADDDFTVRIPSVFAQLSFGVSSTLTMFLLIVAIIALIVGGIMIMNIMLISVSERTKEIGLRKALGARKKDILAQFLVEAGVVALWGGILGIPLGFVGSSLLAFFMKWQTAVSWSAAAGAVVFSIIIGIFFGIQPAKKAASLNPVEALRSE